MILLLLLDYMRAIAFYTMMIYVNWIVSYLFILID